MEGEGKEGCRDAGMGCRITCHREEGRKRECGGEGERKQEGVREEREGEGERARERMRENERE